MLLLLLFFTWDLESGYHHVDIFCGHQRFLGFSWLLSGIESILAVVIFMYLQPLFTTWKIYLCRSAPSWLVSSVGRACGPNFFQAIFQVPGHNCEDRFYIRFFNRSAHIWFSYDFQEKKKKRLLYKPLNQRKSLSAIWHVND